MIGSYRSLDSIRDSIAYARNTIARLSEAGVGVREYITIQSDDEQRMNNAVIAVRVWKQRYASALTDFCSRPGLRLPREVVKQTFRRAA